MPHKIAQTRFALLASKIAVPFLGEISGGIRYGMREITASGSLASVESYPDQVPLYYGAVEFGGEVHPLAEKPGLLLAPGRIFYSALCVTFSEAFSHFLATATLHRFTAIYLEAGALIHFSGKSIFVGGESKGIAVIEAGDPFAIRQFMPGETWELPN